MASKESELEEWPILHLSQVAYEKRGTNQAINSNCNIQLAILLQKLPPSKLGKYDKFPFSSQLGFVHAIPKDHWYWFSWIISKKVLSCTT
jgi:hypothetical protein